MFQRKFRRWLKKLGKKKADVAIGKSLLTVIYTMPRDDRPYREPDPKQMHAMERSKLIRHHAKRLSKLGVDEALLRLMVGTLDAQPEVLLRPAGTAERISGRGGTHTRPDSQSVTRESMQGSAGIPGAPDSCATQTNEYADFKER